MAAAAQLARALQERAALEIFLPVPLLEDVEDGEQAIARRPPSALHLPREALAKALVAQTEGGQDELILRLEVVVECHLRHARLGEDAVDARGMVAVAAEEAERCLEEVFPLAGGHALRLLVGE